MSAKLPEQGRSWDLEISSFRSVVSTSKLTMASWQYVSMETKKSVSRFATKSFVDFGKSGNFSNSGIAPGFCQIFSNGTTESWKRKRPGNFFLPSQHRSESQPEPAEAPLSRKAQISEKRSRNLGHWRRRNFQQPLLSIEKLFSPAISTDWRTYPPLQTFKNSKNATWKFLIFSKETASYFPQYWERAL